MEQIQVLAVGSRVNFLTQPVEIWADLLRVRTIWADSRTVSPAAADEATMIPMDRSPKGC